MGTPQINILPLTVEVLREDVTILKSALSTFIHKFGFLRQLTKVYIYVSHGIKERKFKFREC